MNLAPYIDHTNLKPEATAEDIKKLCAEARSFGFASVCVNSSRVPLAAWLLKGTEVAVCTVVGFPLGAASGASKAFEAQKAAEEGAAEIDMVINIGLLKDGADEDVTKYIKALVDAVPGCIVKVIIETCLLTEAEKVRACRAAMAAGAHFVKTSTGFSTAGATEEDVRLMRETVGTALKIKASGGIRSADFAARLIAAGADRIGASKSVEMCGGRQ
ncbi:MAG: deoxyribose-phosphate aldolase [Cloacibacillus sp.]|nr:deoxyribose-phosphate aldolase [Cloacibacillus sp.]